MDAILNESKILSIWKTRANKSKSQHETNGYVEIWNLVFQFWNHSISENHNSDNFQ